MLTQKDLEEVGKLIEEKLDEKIKFLPTKEEFFTRMDKLSGEIQSVRDAQELHAGQHTDIDDRFEKIDNHLGIDTSV